MKRPITILFLSPRIFNALFAGGISSVGDLVRHSSKQLLSLRGMGKSRLASVIDALEKEGLTLSETECKITSPNSILPVNRNYSAGIPVGEITSWPGLTMPRTSYAWRGLQQWAHS